MVCVFTEFFPDMMMIHMCLRLCRGFCVVLSFSELFACLSCRHGGTCRGTSLHFTIYLEHLWFQLIPPGGRDLFSILISVGVFPLPYEIPQGVFILTRSRLIRCVWGPILEIVTLVYPWSLLWLILCLLLTLGIIGVWWSHLPMIWLGIVFLVVTLCDGVMFWAIYLVHESFIHFFREVNFALCGGSTCHL